MHATDIFGLSEMMGPGVAQECVETKDGLTLWEDHFYPEVVDPLTDEPVADGEEGELVLTALTREAMPVLRYRTRDLTRLLPGTARPSMRRMARITGRSDDLMIVRGVNVFPTQIEELILKRPELAPHYLCILTREGPLDCLTVAVEARQGLEHESAQARTAADRLAHEIKTYVGTSARIELRAAGGIERSLGKAKRVVDQRGK
jgi:phenylacetate-CoA ligase